jgi:formate hydrogenlyase subunit 3/multisubunit Na+/H+ antiporter MnhD subunit
VTSVSIIIAIIIAIVIATTTATTTSATTTTRTSGWARRGGRSRAHKSARDTRAVCVCVRVCVCVCVVLHALNEIWCCFVRNLTWNHNLTRVR